MTREEHLEKTLRNIVAIGDSVGSPASRLLRILDVADKALEEISGQENGSGSFGSIPEPHSATTSERKV